MSHKNWYTCHSINGKDQVIMLVHTRNNYFRGWPWSCFVLQEQPTEATSPCEHQSDADNEVLSPTRGRRISDGILGIMSRLSLSGRTAGDASERMICPWQLDTYCNNGTETALHAAVRGKHVDIVALLLAAGANPNLLTRRGTQEQVIQFRCNIVSSGALLQPLLP